jgi:hypothetical protein
MEACSSALTTLKRRGDRFWQPDENKADVVAAPTPNDTIALHSQRMF